MDDTHTGIVAQKENTIICFEMLFTRWSSLKSRGYFYYFHTLMLLLLMMVLFVHYVFICSVFIVVLNLFKIGKTVIIFSIFVYTIYDGCIASSTSVVQQYVILNE